MANSVKLPADMDKTSESIIEAWGGAEGVRTVLEDHRIMAAKFWDAYSTLLEQHPDKWIAWDGDGVVGVSDSQDDLLRDMKSKNLAAKDVMVEYLDSDPKFYIL